MEFFFSFIFVFVFFFASAEAKSISQYGKYTEYCGTAASNQNEFQNFKRNPLYLCILEHATERQGMEYLKFICEKYPSLIPYFDKFKENDSIGNPITFNYGEFGSFSPTTLQYIRILGDIQSKFGSTSNLKIAEIGGGYGGQCKILHDLDGFDTYAIVDLEQPLKLTQKYLAAQGIEKIEFFQPEELEKMETYDLVISNFAFSEIDRKEQIEYLDKLIEKTSMGYMIINFINTFFNIDTMTLDEILAFIKREDRIILIEEENPSTGNHNIVLSWKTK